MMRLNDGTEMRRKATDTRIHNCGF